MFVFDKDRLSRDPRVVLTLDAGGTKLSFSAMRGFEECVRPFTVASTPSDVGQYLAIMEEGFEKALAEAGGKASAISFGFPGPADYEKGIIGDLPNLKGFRGGVALGAFLEKRFAVPVFINNDGNLFALGEWAAGFLPWVNETLAAAGSGKRFRNLVGLTFGTGFGCGIVCDGHMLAGDNGAAGEIWLLRNKLSPDRCVEATCGRYGIKKTFAGLAGIAYEDAPEAIEIENVALGKTDGNAEAAKRAFEIFGEVAGDAIATALTLVDGLVVIGGGISKGAGLFMPSLMRELSGSMIHVFGDKVPRLLVRPYDLSDVSQLAEFVEGERRTLDVPKYGGTVEHDALKRTGIGISKLGTGRAISLGAYMFAMERL